MTFKVIDAEKKWVQVGNGIVPSISQATTGEVTIPNEIVIDGEAYTVVGIGDYGFYNCDKLTAVWLPESLQFIGKYAFYGCKLIGKIQIPQTVYAIDNTAFEGCTGLSEFSCPYIDGFNYPSCPVTIIGYKASDEDYDVVIPQAVTSIGERAFSLCASIRTMRVEEGNTVFDSRNNCNAIIRTADNVLLFGCKGTMIPETVTAIDAYAFEGHNGLATIAIPAAVVNIGEGAFAGCTGLTAVTSNIQQPYAINDNTFSATTYQTATLYVPYGKKSLYQTTNGWKNFQNIMEMDEEEEMTLEYTDPTSNVVYVYTTTGTTAKVKAGNMSNWTSGSPDASGNVVILDKITVGGKQYTVNEMGDLALYGNNISSITIPATVEKIGKYACYGWYLSNVTVLGSQPAVLTNSCFSEQTYQHATLNLPVGAEDVYFNANGWKEFFSFVKKDGIVYHISSWDQHTAELAGVESDFNGSLDISSSIDYKGEQYTVTQVMFNAFHSNSSITEVIMPASMQLEYYDQYYDWRNIDNPFSSCVNLNTITVAEENPLYDSRNNCNAIIETETNVLLIGCNATVIPDNIVTIARDAFYGATFTEITIPASVQHIGDIAFGQCNNLNAFKVLSKIPCSLDENVFNESSHNVFQYATLYVPKGCKAIYETAEVWKNFANIVEMDVTASDTPIDFADAEVKRICVENWDTNKDGELSNAEAAAVTDLGRAFYNSSISSFDELQYFTGLNEIGEHAFRYSTINQVTLPEGLRTIKRSAFDGTGNLKTIVFPSTLQEIETNAFFYGGLTQIAIPKTITSIGIEPFFACPIETITVDSENPYYDSRENCHALIETATNRLIVGTADAFIPNTVTSIGGGAFYGNPNRSRTTLEIPSSVVNIERCILRGNTAMTSLHIPASVKTINREAFDGVENLSVITVDPDNTNYDSRNDCNAIIETATNILIRGSIAATIPEGVEKISNYAYYENNLTSVVIPNSVREIGSQSFAYCYKLKSIEIPSSVTSIGGSAFSYSPNVEVIKVHIRKPFALSDRCFTGFSGYAVKENATLYVPFGTKSLYEQTDGWKDFKNIVEMEMDADAPIDFADAEVKRICVENWDSNGDGELSYAEAAAVSEINLEFYNSDIVSFEEFQFFTGLTKISGYYTTKAEDGDYYIARRMGFAQCEKLEKITLPSTIERIESNSFSGDVNLQSINLPEGLVLIGEEAFRGCNSLTEITIPESVVSIGDYAFCDCFSISSIFIPKNVRNIGSCITSTEGKAFASIVVDSENPYYDSRDNCNAIIETATNKLISDGSNTVIPTSVTSLGDWTFYGLDVKEVVIPDQITTIGSGSYGGCFNLESINLPASITAINGDAFRYARKLKTVYAYMKSPVALQAFYSMQAFYDVPLENVTLYVPHGSKSAYETADVWKDFKEIIEVKPDNFLYAEETTIKLGGKKTIALQLDNTESLIAAEFRLQLPAGLTIEKDENNNPVVAIVNDRRINHTLTVTDEGNGLYHFLSYSNPIRAYKGNSGDFITLSIVSDGSMEEGTYTATLKGIIFSDENEQKLTFDDCSFNISVINYTPGDANGDGSIDVMDVVKMVSHIMGRNPSSFNQIAADIDGNGKVNVMDLVNLINLIMTTPQQTSGIAPHAQVGSMELSKNGDEAIAVSIPFADRHVAAQFVVSLTDGAVLQEVMADEAHQSKFTRMSDGRYKVMVFSGNNATFNSNSPIKLQLSGNGDVKIEDAMFVDIDEEAVAFESAVLNTTGITAVGTTFAQPVDIYTVGGKLVKNGVTSTKGLAKGMYVVNNQKLIVK